VSYSVWRAAAAGVALNGSNISYQTETISNIGCCCGDPQSEEGFGLSTSKQPKMIKSLTSFTILALLGASAVVFPAFAATTKAADALALPKSDRLPMRSVAHTCSQQVWSDFGNGRLLNSGKDAKVLVAYLTTARR
jgi:hypothetical protein